MFTITLALCLGAQPVPPPPVQFDRITPEDAKRLEGTELRVTFTPDRWATTVLIDGVQHTHAGPEEFDEHGRTVILKGDGIRALSPPSVEVVQAPAPTTKKSGPQPKGESV